MLLQVVDQILEFFGAGMLAGFEGAGEQRRHLELTRGRDLAGGINGFLQGIVQVEAGDSRPALAGLQVGGFFAVGDVQVAAAFTLTFIALFLTLVMLQGHQFCLPGSRREQA
ncbi:hypothetical protein D3C78_1428190 [compost metagenome]